MAGVDDTSVGEVVAVESGGEIQVGRSAVAAQRRRGGRASRRFSATLLDRIRVMNVGGETTAAVNLVLSAPAPTFLSIALHDGGPLTIIGLGAPDHGADQRPKLAVEPTW
jgi:hypothetical protein